MTPKKGFTFIEIIIIVIIIGIGFITVIEALKNSTNYLQKTRQKIIAINLAREGVEQVINIRNTNRQKRAGEKEKTRLKMNPGQDENNDGVINDSRLGSGNYIILATGTNNQQYFYAQQTTAPLIIESGFSNSNNQHYSLCETNGFRSPCPGQIPQSKEGYFFRTIKGYGLFQKDTTTQGGDFLPCTNGEESGCGDETAKEYRFCSIVEYIGKEEGKVELCTILTNFAK